VKFSRRRPLRYGAGFRADGACSAFDTVRFHSPSHVLGWPIRHTTDDVIVLGARSWLGMPAELVFARQGKAWLFVTLVQHDNRFMSALWWAIAARHRRVVQYLLRSAAARRASVTASDR
jgi:hypothetical protein